MSGSNLYRGFSHAGALPSIRTQRETQGKLVAELRPERLLSVGCAYGDELAHLICRLPRSMPSTVTAVDVENVGDVLVERFRSYGVRPEFVNLDLLQLDRCPAFGTFDVSQCGFVMHDIEWLSKELALRLLSQSIQGSGCVLLSEMFPREHEDLEVETKLIYSHFLEEAYAARRQGSLSEGALAEFLGDGVGPGLLRSRADAVQGERHYYDTMSALLERAARVGLKACQIIWNPVCDRLAVVILRPSASPGELRHVL